MTNPPANALDEMVYPTCFFLGLDLNFSSFPSLPLYGDEKIVEMRQADSYRNEVLVTSRHRASPVFEWSKMTSRNIVPYFVALPTPNTGASIQGVPSKPQRHMQSPLPMDRSVGRNGPRPIDDVRDYTPKTHEEWHPKTAVDIGRAPERVTAFGKAPAGGDAALEPYKYASEWGRGKRSWMPKSDRSQGSPIPDAQKDDPENTVGGTSPLPSEAQRSNNRSRPLSGNDNKSGRRLASALGFDASYLESKHPNPAGGFIPKSDERALVPYPDRPPLEAHYSVVERHTSDVKLANGAGRGRATPKPSEKYLALFRLPPPAPLAAPEKKRFFGGYAVQGALDREMNVKGLLRMADSANRRALSCMENCFKIERSPLRTAFLYTPPLASTPEPSK